MSLANVHVGTDQVVIITDTRARFDSGEWGELPKVVALPYLDAVIVGRGPLAFAPMVWMLCQLKSGILDFDALKARLPSVIAEAFDLTIRGRPIAAGRRAAGACTDSVAAARPAVGFVASEISPWRVGPELGPLFDGMRRGESVTEAL